MKKASFTVISIFLAILMTIYALPAAALEKLAGIEKINGVSDVSETSVET